MGRRLIGLGILLLGLSCQRTQSKSGPAAQADAPASAVAHADHHVPEVVPLPVCDAHGLPALDAARKAYDAGKYDAALACAAQAAATQPDDPQAHSERAAALSALGRFDEAKLAYARALAIDPDHLDALLGAAHLYGVSLPSSRDNDELAALYAERGRQLAVEAGDTKTAEDFAVLSAMTLNDLGEAHEALNRAEEALAHDPKSADALYERAVALFELCRFKDAKSAFEKMLTDPDHDAHAHQHLGLLLEREGKWKEAEAHFAKARELAPQDFPEPQLLSEADFSAAVKKALSQLPGDMQRDLKGIPVQAEELPKDEDLLSGEPPLSPTILGLYRGPPLSQPCDADAGSPCRSVAIYRRNLARAVTSRPELFEQIRVTLLHEIGHLRGEDDLQLAARGLE